MEMVNRMDDGGLTGGYLTQPSSGDGAPVIVRDGTAPRCIINPSLRVLEDWYGWVTIGVSRMGWMRRWQRVVIGRRW